MTGKKYLNGTRLLRLFNELPEVVEVTSAPSVEIPGVFSFVAEFLDGLR